MFSSKNNVKIDFVNYGHDDHRVHVKFELDPETDEGFAAGLNSGHFKSDLSKFIGQKNDASTRGALTAEILDQAYKASLGKFGRPSTIAMDKHTIEKINVKSDQEIATLRSQITTLQDKISELEQDIEHYKMLALEN